MQRRTYLKLLAGSATGLSMASSHVTAASASELEKGVWYDAEITDNVDGDTFRVYVYENGTEYTTRQLGIDTPEKSGYTHYDHVYEWEGIEDETYLEDWGNDASDFAADELPIGTSCQVKLDPESEKIDVYDRLLCKIRYDRDGDGSWDTVYNEYALEQGYARVYCASMSNTDEYWDLEATARANGTGIWAQSDPENTTEFRDNDVAQTFHPNTSSVRTTDGAIADSRVPIWAESEATQNTISSSAVEYDSIPLVGVDEANNVAMFGGQPIQEEHDEASDHLEHFVFLTNLVDHLASKSGMVLVDGGHHQFNATYSCSSEDVLYYQRYLEGQGIELASTNELGGSDGATLADSRAIIVTSPQDSFTASEVDELADYVDDGGAVVLMGSYKSTSEGRDNLNALASDLGSDLRLNEDEVTDSTNNADDDSDLVVTTDFNTTDFSLWSAYDGSAQSYVVSIERVERHASTLEEEFVDLTNDGSSSVDTSGWTIENEEGQAYAFPEDFTLEAGETVRVHTGDGEDSDTDLYWGASMFRWDRDEDECIVYDAEGNVAHEVDWSVEDVIIPEISEDGDTLNDEWVDFENREGSTVDLTGWRVEDEVGYTYDFPADFSLSDGSTVRLHTGEGDDTDTDLYWNRGSAVWNNDGDTAYLYDDADELVQTHEYPPPYDVSITDLQEDGEDSTDEWVDVRNDGSSILDMSGFTLQDEAGYTYTFPDSFGLDAGATVRVHTGEGEDTETDLYWGMGIAIWNNDGDTAYVHDDNGRLADEYTYPTSSCDSTLCVGEINEDGDSLNDEWVEFDNTGSSDQDMTGWSVEDEAGYTYDFPDDYTITSGGTSRLHTGDGEDDDVDGHVYWGSGMYIWNNDGDTVYLYEPDGTLHTSKSY